jgi:hypothetical protein
MPTIHIVPFHVLLLVTTLYGAALCFMGYRLVENALGLFGFLLGAAAGLSIAQAMGAGGVGQIAGAVVGGLFGALLVFTAYFVGLFLLGAFAASSAAQVFVGGPDAQLIVLGAGVLGGALAVVFRKVMIVFATATSGATLVMWSVALYLSGTHVWDPQQAASRLAKMGPAMTLGWLGLAAAGLLVQIRARPKQTKARAADQN